MRQAGWFGDYGGQFVSELLLPVVQEIADAYDDAKRDDAFWEAWHRLLSNYAGRPTPLYHAENISRDVDMKVFLKREDLLHGGAHKTNNTLGQGLLAKRMGKRRLIAETGAGQHGVATAMIGALLEIPVLIFMGAKDAARQAPNVARMKLFGAEVRPVAAGAGTLKEAINEAMRYWTANAEDTFYVFGTAAGPHPFPTMVRDFQAVIGREARADMLSHEGALPDVAVACVGGGSNAIGLFSAFIDDPTELIGVEPAGLGLDGNQHGATLQRGRPGCLHGSISYVLQSADGQIQEAHSISAGLDYPGVGPEHSQLRDSGRVHYTSATDEAALEAVRWLSAREGIIPALESAHALAALRPLARAHRGARVLVNLSGRGDKDLETILSAGGAP